MQIERKIALLQRDRRDLDRQWAKWMHLAHNGIIKREWLYVLITRFNEIDKQLLKYKYR